MPRRTSGGRSALCALSVAAILMLFTISNAYAFKPYTHWHAADEALQDVIDNGKVTIAGREYPVAANLLSAIQNQRAHYNAGVIGPDGFPDLVMGQGIIHPTNTGAWLAHIYAKMIAAQSDPQYSAAERQQILAFGHGYLTHAAGDLWAHTMVNEFADGVFPGVADILGSPSQAAIALRHVLVEGYVGDATPGFDAKNSPPQDQGGGDLSDDNTPGIPFDAPHRFVYETFVKQNNGAPEATARGSAIEFFIDLRAQLQSMVTDATIRELPNIQSNYNEVLDKLAQINPCDCNFGDDETPIPGTSPVEYCEDHCYVEGLCTDLDDLFHDAVECGGQISDIFFQGAVEVVIDTAAEYAAFVEDQISAALAQFFNYYLLAWIADIDEGLEAWSELGLAITKGLFDPQTRRDAQNSICLGFGPESAQAHIDCEAGVGMIGSVKYATNDFVNEHLLSMLGLPDEFGELRAFLQEIGGSIDQLFADLGIANPVALAEAEINAAADELIKDFISERFGIDIDEMESYLNDPAFAMDQGTATLTIGGQPVQIGLFQNGDRAKLDGYLGLSQPHTGPMGALGDNEEFQTADFAPYANTVLMSKLILLSPATLNQLIGDLLNGHTVDYYQAGDNIMTKSLPGATANDPRWLFSIDADHSWRADREPIFHSGYEVEFADGHKETRASGGNGNFPLWESCLLRDSVFRTLFVDWESAAGDFSPATDPEFLDPRNDEAPTSQILVGTPQYTGGGNLYVAGNARLEVDASDDFWFPSEIPVTLTILPDGVAAEADVTVFDGNVIVLPPRIDRGYTLRTSVIDDCQTNPTITNLRVVLDTAPPVITITEPMLVQYTPDQMIPIVFSIDDGIGSGIATQSATFNGQPIASGAILDAFLMDPGTYTLALESTDHLGYADAKSTTFRLRATSQSMMALITRAADEDLIQVPGIDRALLTKLQQAVVEHDAGRHFAEWNILSAFVNQMLDLRGVEIDATTADRLIAYARDLVLGEQDPTPTTTNMPSGGTN